MKTNTYPEEIIGKTIEVVESKNSSNVGIKGKIIDETKKTILVKTKKGEKRLLKSNITIIIHHKNAQKSKISGTPETRSVSKRIKGKNLLKRSEERIK
ncbi:ribonuclease P protein subunit [Candidatus Woesearchaeota archaeon]|nr:ribonuclease P protein subunit [Candidatus Woesearchaeota archaeon]